MIPEKALLLAVIHTPVKLLIVAIFLTSLAVPTERGTALAEIGVSTHLLVPRASQRAF
jgi:hypothetical protein